MNDNPDYIASRLRHSLDSRGTAPELSPELVSSASTRTAPRLVNPQRRLKVAGGATLAIAVVAIGSLVVTSPFQREPLFVAGGSGSGTAFSAASEAATSDMRMGVWVNYEYIAGAGLSTDRGTGSVYQLRLTGTPQQTVTDVASTFGVEGAAAESDYFDPAYPSYVVGAQDGTGPSVYVTWSGTGNWSYNNPGAYPPLECEAVAIEDSSVATEDALIDPGFCEVPEISASDSLAPSEAEARDQARTIFASTGLDVATDDIRVTVDPWQTSAAANLVVDGIATAIEWGVSWSPTGEIAWAYGHAVDVVDRGSFGTVSATEAVDRLADGRWFGSAGPAYQGGMTLMTSEMARMDDSILMEAPVDIIGEEIVVDPMVPVPGEVPTGEEPAGEAPAIEPGTIEPGNEPSVDLEPMPAPDESLEPIAPMEPFVPETVVVSVDEAEATLLLMWDSEGNAWLVPGFAMQQPEGWWNSVVSLEEGVIQLPEPIEYQPFDLEGTVEEDAR